MQPPHPRRPDPMAAEIFEVFGGRVFGAASPEPVLPNPLYPGVCDLSGGRPTAFHVGFSVGADDVRVTTTLAKPGSDNLVTNLLLHVVHHIANDDELQFPLDLSVTRKQLPLRIDGRTRTFTAYVSGGRSSAVASAGNGIFVAVECAERQLHRLALRKMTMEEVDSRLYRRPPRRPSRAKP